MRLSLKITQGPPADLLRRPLLGVLLAGGIVSGGSAVGALLALAVLAGCAAAVVPQDAPPRVERRLGLMGTWLSLEVEAASRAEALVASEAALRALEAAEQRLSTWRDDSELARLNRCPIGASFALSPALARELEAVRGWCDRTGGAFDPSVGALVRAWGLRTGGRRPEASDLQAAREAVGLDALELDGGVASRGRADLELEEGGFGKGAGLDAAIAALRRAGVRRARVDLGGQVAVLGAGREPFDWGVAHPAERDTAVARVALDGGSLATSGNAERGLLIDGERLGHLLDPRTGLPAADFGSLTVWAPDALAADCLSTGLYVLGPDAALAFARREPGVDVLTLEPRVDGTLRLRATGRLAAGLQVLDPRVRVEHLPASPQDDLLEARPRAGRTQEPLETERHR